MGARVVSRKFVAGYADMSFRVILSLELERVIVSSEARRPWVEPTASWRSARSSTPALLSARRVPKRKVAWPNEHAQHRRYLVARQPFVPPLPAEPVPGHRVDGAVRPRRFFVRVNSEDAEHVEAALPRRAAEMEARREDTLDSVACDDGVEEWPDSIVSGDYGFDMRSKVMCGAGLDDLEIRVVRPVQQQAVMQNEVSQEFVRRVGDRRGVDDASVSASSDDESIHCFALCLAWSVRRALG